MNQRDINKDLGHYLDERKKTTPFWKKVFGSNPTPKEKVQEEIKEDLEKAKEQENIAPEEKEELEQIEHKIEEVNKVEDEVEEKIEEEHEGLLKKFFKKLNFSKNESKADADEDFEDDKQPQAEHTELHAEKSEIIEEKHERKIIRNTPDHGEKPTKQLYEPVAESAGSADDEEVREMLKNLHGWIVQLPPEKLQEFKSSKDFQLYTKVLKKYKLIK